MKEEKKDIIHEKLGEIEWDDSNIKEIMEGFFNSPQEAIDPTEGEISDDHYESLWDLLDC